MAAWEIIQKKQINEPHYYEVALKLHISQFSDKENQI